MDTLHWARGNRGLASTYVYKTTLLRGRFTLGLPPLKPPGPGRGWEVCAISYVTDGLMVSWRCPSHVQPQEEPDS